MKCYQILFSPTGGTEKVAAAITQNWPEVQTIDLSSTSTDFASFFIESDSLVLVAISAVAEHSIIREYAAGRPNAEDCKQLSAFGTKIFEKALSGSLAVPAIPGKRPYKKSSSGFVPSTDSHCTNCGLCAEKCPAQAISKDNGKVTDKSKCISCMRCVSICPVHARSLNKVTVSVVASAIKKACSVQKSNELFL